MKLSNIWKQKIHHEYIEHNNKPISINYGLSIKNDKVDIIHYIESYKSGSRYLYKVELNGKKLSASNKLVLSLYNIVKKIHERTNFIIQKLYLSVNASCISNRILTNPKVSEDELRDRCEEFYITKDNRTIDSISLNQLYDFYNFEYTDQSDFLNKNLEYYKSRNK